MSMPRLSARIPRRHFSGLMLLAALIVAAAPVCRAGGQAQTVGSRTSSRQHSSNQRRSSQPTSRPRQRAAPAAITG